MAYTTIKKPSSYLNTVTYTGNGSTQNITGVGFQPDWVWIKNRSSVTNHEVADVVRGANKLLKTNAADAEQSISTKITSFDSDGFGIGSDANVNGNGNSLVAWNWLANNTSGSSNTDGSITSTVSANTTSGFSIVKYTGTGANATVGHGLGAVPKMIIAKRLTDVESWGVYHVSNGASKYMKLDENQIAETATTVWNNTTPTSSVFSLGASGLCNGSSKDMIAYCFAEKQGFSKFGSYTGNGNVDGSFIYTGFKPAFVIIKRTNSSANWIIRDNKRDSYNYTYKTLEANGSTAEADDSNYNRVDFISNGFKLRGGSAGSGTDTNGSGDTYIYMAFAEEPLVGDNPATAR